MIYLLLALSIVFASCKSSMYNSYAKSQRPDMYGVFKFNAVAYGVATLVALVIGIEKTVSMSTIIWASTYGVLVLLMQALSIAAMTIGPMAATSLMVVYGLIIPTVAGPIFWNESFNIIQGIGVVFILLSMWLLTNGDSKSGKANKSWILLAILCFLFSGLVGLSEKIHQSTDGKDERIMFLIVACSVMFLLSLCSCFILKGRSQKSLSAKSVAIHGIVSGLLIGMHTPVNLTLAGKLDAMIYYPVANGGAMILTVLLSVFLFKEKCTKKSLAGIIIGLLSVILVSVG